MQQTETVAVVSSSTAASQHGVRTAMALTLTELIDAFMADYAGREKGRANRLSEWIARLGDRPAAGITDDDVFHVLDALEREPARIYLGRDVTGRPIYDADERARLLTACKPASPVSLKHAGAAAPSPLAAEQTPRAHLHNIFSHGAGSECRGSPAGSGAGRSESSIRNGSVIPTS